MIPLLRSEWTKIRSLRSMSWPAVAAVATAAVAGYLMWRGVAAWDAATPAQRGALPLPAVERLALPSLQLCAAGFGVLAIVSEYGGGTLRTSLTAVPRRSRLYLAKATVVAAVAFAGGLAALVAAGALVRMAVGDRPVAVEMLAIVDDAPMLLASAFLLSAIALTGVGLGAALRSSAGALACLAALLFGPSVVAAYLPGAWGEILAALAWPESPRQVAAHGVLAGPLAPWQAVCWMAFPAVAASLAGGIRFARADA